MKISALKQQVKNPERVSIFVDGKYSFSLSLDELVKHKLKKGDELDQAQIKKYKKISADGKLRARTLEWLLNRPHSKRELRDYLYRKQAEKEQIEELVDNFSQKGYVDDAKFSEWFVSLHARRGKSDRAIKSELFKKGVDSETASSALEQSERPETERLKAVIAKKRGLSRYQKDPLKLTKYLVTQGFSYQQVKEQLKLD